MSKIECNENCIDCMKEAPYEFCCKLECGEHEFCKGCVHYVL